MLPSHKSVKWAVTATAVIAAMMLASAAAQAGPVLYVDDDAPPGGDGAGWGTAYRFLADALATASGGGISEIHVAQGTYAPDRDELNPLGTGDRQATFPLLNGVALTGGYAGFGAPDPDARDPELYETILSGDLVGDDLPDFVNYDENSWHVVTGSGTDATAVIDGFTITAGNATGPQWPPDFESTGAGLLNDAGSPTVGRCRFISNRALDGGAGMSNVNGSSPTVHECLFDRNLVEESASGDTGGGGGMLNAFVSHPNISNCTFSNNVADFGGGVQNFDGCQPAYADCTFEFNTARHRGGGLYLEICSNVTITGCTFNNNVVLLQDPPYGDSGGIGIVQSSDVTVIGCTVRGNSGRWGGGIACAYSDRVTVVGCTIEGNSAVWGGGMAVQEATPTIVNCLFTGNEADGYGGGLHTSTEGNPAMINCTFSMNAANSWGGGVYTASDANPTLSSCILWDNAGGEIGGDLALVVYSDVKGGYEGEGNIDADPLFVYPPLGNYRLSSGSPCIDAADNNAVPKGIDVDLDGNLRFIEDPKTADTGTGLCLIVDMGVYEFQEGTPECCLWDLNGDGSVGILDLLGVLGAWGTDPGGPPDFDGDGNVGILDLLTLLANWGPCA